MKTNPQSIDIFISYSHLDMKYKEKLINSLKSLELGYNINTWHDGKILAGNNIDSEVLNHLAKSQIVLLLLTPNFLSSWYCIKVELEKAISLMNQGKCLVIPVVFLECTLVENLPFYKLKRVPQDGKAIASKSFKNQTTGCTQATNMIKDLINEQFPNCKINENNISKTQENKQANKLSIQLIKNGKLQPIEIEQKFVDQIPTYVTNLMNFSSMMEQALASAIDRYKKGYRKNLSDLNSFQIQQFKLFLMDICSYVKKYVTDTVGIRVHFRCVSHGNYIGIIASTDNDDSDDLATNWSTDLTPIPVYSGLIPQSEKLKSSILKTLNSRINFKGTNNNLWKEYLTRAFTNLNKGSHSLLSMGISVHKNYYSVKEDLMQFLAYIDFGGQIEDYIKRYLEQCFMRDKTFTLENIVSNIQ